MQIINRLIDCGVRPEMEEFKAERKRTYNRVSLVLLGTYLLTFIMGVIISSPFLSIIVAVSFGLGLLSFYFCSKDRMILSRAALTVSPWIVLTGLSIYFGKGSGAAFALFTTAILWFIIFNRLKSIIVIEVLNSAVFVANLYIQEFHVPMFTGDEFIVDCLQIFIVLASIFVVMIVMVMFKRNSYKFLSMVRNQKVEIEERQSEIEASIRYAKNIQASLMPSEETIASIIKDYFILFKPKEEVSGDMYWVGEQDERTFIVLGDCTGHGIPGAMISILGLASIDHFFTKKKINSPAMFLEELNEEFRLKLSQSNLNDGIDMSVVMFDSATKKWSFSGANNCLVTVSEDVYTILRGDKKPIGLNSRHTDPYSNMHVEVAKGDSIYLFSDGYRDQFGGERGKKFGFKPFKRLLQKNASLKFEERMPHLIEEFNKWKGCQEQIDDVSVIGIKLS